MRVVIAPDSFGGSLSAPAAAEAIAVGWARRAPVDELCRVPLSDGGPGFVDVLHTALGGEPRESTVAGPLPGQRVSARWLRVGETAYLEAAQACGLHLVDRIDPDAARAASSFGVGELVADALATGVSRLVVGLGGSACTDGGAGLLAGLGRAPLDVGGAVLPRGGAALARSASLAAGRRLPETIELVLAADVDNPLVGRHGAAAVFGPQKGADAAAVAELDAALARWVEVLGAACDLDPEVLAATPGAGAAGGLGAALLALGGRRVSGANLVRELAGLDAALDHADLVLTGEGRFDWQSLRGKLVTAVAGAAAERGLPCLVLAGQVEVGRREAAAIGIEEAYSVAEHVGGVPAALADPGGTLGELASAVAARWSGR